MPSLVLKQEAVVLALEDAQAHHDDHEGIPGGCRRDRRELRDRRGGRSVSPLRHLNGGRDSAQRRMHGD
jgi:hypothetical protein